MVRLALEKKTGELYACKSISKAKLITKEDVSWLAAAAPAALRGGARQRLLAPCARRWRTCGARLRF